MKYAKQRDVNEPSIVQALEAVGAAVQKLGDAGVPDLLVSFGGVLYLLEVKNPNAKGGGKYNTGAGALTDTQTRWWARWRGKMPAIVQTAAEALAAIGAVRQHRWSADQPGGPRCLDCGWWMGWDEHSCDGPDPTHLERGEGRAVGEPQASKERG